MSTPLTRWTSTTRVFDALGAGGRAYVVGASAGIVARGLSLAAGFGNLWLLTRILTKAEFAGYVFVMALSTWLALLGTGGLDRLLVYRLSRADAPPGTLVGGGLAATALLVALPLGGALALLVVGAASLGARTDLPGLTFWAAVAAPVLVAVCLGRVCEAWYLARGRVTEAVLVPAIGEIARTILLAGAFLLLPTRAGVAAAVVGAAVVMLLVWWAVVPRGALQRPERVPRADVAYGVKAMLARASNEGAHQLDVVMIGLLATATAVAEYAVAVRLAALVSLVKGLLAPVLTPRLGRLAAAGDPGAVEGEYARARLLGLVPALALAALLVLAGLPLLGLFGEYDASFPLLAILVAGNLVSSGFGANSALLTIMGHAGWTLVARVGLLAALVALNVALIPRFGATGAALAMVIGTVGVNALLAWCIWHLDRVRTVTGTVVALVGAATALLVLLGVGVMHVLPASAGLATLAAVLLVLERARWAPHARRLLANARAPR